jgi:hypothetical protein
MPAAAVRSALEKDLVILYGSSLMSLENPVSQPRQDQLLPIQERIVDSWFGSRVLHVSFHPFLTRLHTATQGLSSLSQLFDWIDLDTPLGSASISQVWAAAHEDTPANHPRAHVPLPSRATPRANSAGPIHPAGAQGQAAFLQPRGAARGGRQHGAPAQQRGHAARGRGRLGRVQRAGHEPAGAAPPEPGCAAQPAATRCGTQAAPSAGHPRARPSCALARACRAGVDLDQLQPGQRLRVVLPNGLQPAAHPELAAGVKGQPSGAAAPGAAAGRPPAAVAALMACSARGELPRDGLVAVKVGAVRGNVTCGAQQRFTGWRVSAAGASCTPDVACRKEHVVCRAGAIPGRAACDGTGPEQPESRGVLSPKDGRQRCTTCMHS